MVRTLRARWVLTASALLVCAFLVGFTEDFIHTDDGCEVETHCLACQRLLVSVGVGTVAPVWRPAIDVTGRVTPCVRVLTLETDALPSASRAPPLAA